jgi:isopenicillin-N N-acyltransferase-like protein
MTGLQKLGAAIVLAIAVLLTAGTTYVASFRAAPAAGYEPPPLDLRLVSKPDPAFRVQKVSDHLYRVNGLRVVHVWGSPREMGRQQGEALAAEIKAGLRKYMQRKVRDDWGYSVEYQRRCAASMVKHIPPEYIEEMHGLAEGAGVPYEEILLLHTHADMVHFGKEWGKVTDGRQRRPESLCSNFVAFGPATVDGKVYHGRNLDWTTGTGIQETAMLLIAEPEGKVPFALLAWAGCVGGVTGMNAEGITFGEMTSSTADETLDGMPLFFACRHILDSCHDLSEVEEFVKTYPGTTGWNWMVADGDVKDARAFEVDAKQRVVYKPNDPHELHPPMSYPIPNAIRRTNHPITPCLQESIASRARITGIRVPIVRTVVPFLDTWQRYAALGYWISEEYNGRIDERIARAMLQSAPVAGRGNLHSAVFNASDRVMWVANASLKDPAWSQPYVRVDLKEWLGRDR